MKLGEALLKKINAVQERAALVRLRFRDQDVVVRTDEEGQAVQVFLGRADTEGRIRGDRFSRTIVKDREGKVIKDYWERKGKATP